MKRRGAHLINGHLPIRPLDNATVPLHEHRQTAAAASRALRLPQHNPTPLEGRPQRAVTVGGQRLRRKRAAASLTDRPRDHFLAVDPELQLGSPSRTRRQHDDLKAIEHPTSLRGSPEWGTRARLVRASCVAHRNFDIHSELRAAAGWTNSGKVGFMTTGLDGRGRSAPPTTWSGGSDRSRARQ